MSADLVTWLRATLDAIESDARSFLESHPDLPDWASHALAEVEAKRRILDEHGWEYSDPYESWKGEEYRAKWGDTRNQRHCTCCGGAQHHPNLGMVPRRVAWPCPTVRLLALPLADEPGYPGGVETLSEAIGPRVGLRRKER